MTRFPADDTLSEGSEQPLPNGVGASIDPELGQKATLGFAWSIIQALGSKAVAILGQLILAWMVAPQEFGKIGLVYTVTALANILQQTGQREILVQRQGKLRRWLTPAVWMSFFSGLAAASLMVVVAPIAAAFYQSPGIIGLIVVYSFWSPISSLIFVAQAVLETQMRFRLIAAINFATALAVTTLSIILAACHFGAYSFVIPWPIIGTLRLAAVWYFARPPIRLSPQFGRWRFLAGDGMRVLAARACGIIISQGDYITLQMVHRPLLEPVGIYYFAFSLSMQTVMLAGVTFDSILFPTFSKLRMDRLRQTEAFLKTVRLIAICAIPLCVLQAGLADPIIQLIFAPNWHPSIPIVQILSLGMALRIIGWASQNLLQSQGKFSTYSAVTFIGMLLFLAMVRVGAQRSPDRAPVGVAIGASIYFFLEGLVMLILAVGQRKLEVKKSLKLVGLPFALSLIAVGSGMCVARNVSPSPIANVLKAATTTVVSVMIYIPSIYFFAKGSFDDLMFRVRRLMRLRRR